MIHETNSVVFYWSLVEYFFTIIFSDISPHNILIDRHSQIKIIDFGYAETFSGDYFSIVHGDAKAPEFNEPVTEQMKKYVNSPKGKEKTRVWYIGSVIYYILTNGRSPSTVHDVYQNIIAQPPTLKKYLISSLEERNARMTVKQIRRLISPLI